MTQFFRHTIASLLLFIYLPLSVAVPFLHCHDEIGYTAQVGVEVQAAHDASHHEALSECMVCLACQFLHSHFSEPVECNVQALTFSYIAFFPEPEDTIYSASETPSSRGPPPSLFA